MKKIFACIACSLMLANSSFSQFQMTPGTQKMSLAMYAIKNLYVDNVDENKLVEEGIRAMVKELDPHSAYMTADEMKEMNEPLQGGFDGIGISFNMMNDTLLVIEVISGGPSEKVGLLPGDRILFVDKVPIAGVKMANRDVMKRLKGPKGTLVTVTVKRRNNPELMDFKIIRDKIPIYSLDASFMVDKKTGYIRLNRFGATTADEFREAFKNLQKQGMTQLILDLESNGGGYMNAAIELADEFLPDKKSIVYTEGIHSPRQDNESTSKGCFENGRLVIMIDEYTASASEILSGAIQDWDRGVVIGRRSFGKGLVQRPIPLPDGSMLKLTVARYFTPSGRFIQKPYENAENYSRDLIDRYNRGEMRSADSIHFPDSLRTETLENHRTIYGGGGIMPDVFIPIDTAKYTSLHKLISNSGVMTLFSMKYVDDHRAELNSKYPTIDAFVENFQPDQALTDALLSYAKSEKLKLTAADSASDKTLMMRQLKAYMARDLGKSADYYKVTWRDNETLMKAIEIINDKKAYNDLLKRK
jgi:carboxyl-terminal processing protease